jgi:taurine dioxygenase
LDGAR